MALKTRACALQWTAGKEGREGAPDGGQQPSLQAGGRSGGDNGKGGAAVVPVTLAFFEKATMTKGTHC